MKSLKQCETPSRDSPLARAPFLGREGTSDVRESLRPSQLGCQDHSWAPAVGRGQAESLTPMIHVQLEEAPLHSASRLKGWDGDPRRWARERSSAGPRERAASPSCPGSPGHAGAIAPAPFARVRDKPKPASGQLLPLAFYLHCFPEPGPGEMPAA